MPNHHAYAEHFLFEPRLEPGISPEIITELEAQDIRLIYVLYNSFTQSEFSLLSPDDWPTCGPVKNYGDLNRDGRVQAADFALLLTDWGACPITDSCVIDIDGDRQVDEDDLSVLINLWD